MTVNPGGHDARWHGCLCPVLDNGHGRSPYMGYDDNGQGRWAIRADCPIHGGAIPRTECGFCHNGMVESTPGRPEDGPAPCPYCDGTGEA